MSVNLKNGEYFEVVSNGALGIILEKDLSTVWVEWQSFPGVSYPYKNNEITAGMWASTSKTFSTRCSVKAPQVDERLLEEFEKILNDCSHSFETYEGLSHKDEYCTKCTLTRPISK